MTRSTFRQAAYAVLTVVLTVVICLAAGEAFLRIKNSSMKNYDIEMWRYALELKKRSENPILGHDHVKSANAILQSVEIRTNAWGLRGADVPPPTPGKRRILFLGSSVTLGWGVSEAETVTERLRMMFLADGQDVEILNGGIGNYNTVRYVERFLTELRDLHPTDIVVHYFLRDAETLEPGTSSFLLRNSELAATVWISITRYFSQDARRSVEDHYRDVYRPDAPGFVAMQASLKRLADYAHANGIRLYLAMTPEVRDLVNYRFAYVHDLVKDIATADGYTFVDLLPAMRNLTPQELWSMPGDPHPNALGHLRMAEAIYPVLSQVR